MKFNMNKIMKKLILIVIFFSSIQLFSQDKVSYKIDSYYYEKEGIEIPNLRCEIIDKKSLREAKEKAYKNSGLAAIEVYYTLDLNLDFFEIAKKIKISKDSTIYLLHIQPVDMSYFRIGYLIDIPENILITQLSTTDKPFRKSGYNKSYKIGEAFDDYLQYDVFSGDFILKVIQVGKAHQKFNINIRYIDCHLANKKNTFDNRLSGVGMMENKCGNSVTCLPEAEDWVNEYKGVFRIIEISSCKLRERFSSGKLYQNICGSIFPEGNDL